MEQTEIGVTEEGNPSTQLRTHDAAIHDHIHNHATSKQSTDRPASSRYWGRLDKERETKYLWRNTLSTYPATCKCALGWTTRSV